MKLHIQKLINMLVFLFWVQHFFRRITLKYHPDIFMLTKRLFVLDGGRIAANPEKLRITRAHTARLGIPSLTVLHEKHPLENKSNIMSS